MPLHEDAATPLRYRFTLMRCLRRRWLTSFFVTITSLITPDATIIALSLFFAYFRCHDALYAAYAMVLFIRLFAMLMLRYFRCHIVADTRLFITLITRCFDAACAAADTFYCCAIYALILL